MIILYVNTKIPFYKQKNWNAILKRVQASGYTNNIPYIYRQSSRMMGLLSIFLLLGLSLVLCTGLEDAVGKLEKDSVEIRSMVSF